MSPVQAGYKTRADVLKGVMRTHKAVLGGLADLPRSSHHGVSVQHLDSNLAPPPGHIWARFALSGFSCTCRTRCLLVHATPLLPTSSARCVSSTQPTLQAANSVLMEPVQEENSYRALGDPASPVSRRTTGHSAGKLKAFSSPTRPKDQPSIKYREVDHPVLLNAHAPPRPVLPRRSGLK